jgi:ribonuclease BN (tRNA processing enzyme)
MAGVLSDIRVTILGSGTCVPSLRRSSCAVLVQTGDANIVIDAGPGTMRRLLEAGLRVFDVSHLLLSHFHPDHSGELVPFLFSNKYPDGTLRGSPLTIAAGRGLTTFFDRLRDVYGHWIELEPVLVRLIELDNRTVGTRGFNGFSLNFGPVRHNPESTAYRITGTAGSSVVYSGDTDCCDSLVELARDADVLICESALPDEMKVTGHLTPSLAGDIAARAGVGKLVLTHFYPECDTVDVAAQCRKTWTGPLVLAEDLMVVEI